MSVSSIMGASSTLAANAYLIQVGDKAYSSIQQNQSATSGIRVGSLKTISQRVQNSYIADGFWLEDNGLNSDYEVRCQQISGDAVEGDVLNTYLSCDSGRQWRLVELTANSSKTCTIRCRIRRKVNFDEFTEWDVDLVASYVVD